MFSDIQYFNFQMVVALPCMQLRRVLGYVKQSRVSTNFNVISFAVSKPDTNVFLHKRRNLRSIYVQSSCEYTNNINFIKMNKYLQLATVGTNYANRMNRLSNRIFGEVTRPTNLKSMKVVKLFSEKPIQKRPDIVNYYPEHTKIHTLMLNLREYGLFRDEHQDFKEEYERLRELRGKKKWVPPHKRK